MYYSLKEIKRRAWTNFFSPHIRTFEVHLEPGDTASEPDAPNGRVWIGPGRIAWHITPDDRVESRVTGGRPELVDVPDAIARHLVMTDEGITDPGAADIAAHVQVCAQCRDVARGD